MGEFVRNDARVRTKRLWLLLASIVFVLGGFTPLIGLIVHGIGFERYWTVVAVVPYFAVQWWLLHLWNNKWLERRGQLRADERGVWLDGTIVVPRSALRHGHVVRQGDVVLARLDKMLQPVEIVVEDEADGTALLAAMRLDAPRSVGQYTMNHGTYRSAWIRAAIVIVLWAGPTFGLLFSEHLLGVIGIMLFWLPAITVWTLNQFVRVSIGADGVHLRRFPFRRFVPFSAVEAASLDGRNVTIHLRDGQSVTMHHPTSGKGWKPLLYRDRADEGRLLVDRINTHVERHLHDGAEVHVLARGARTTREWLQEVVLASDEHASFRTPAVPPDELWRVLEDPVAAKTARAGAAIALRKRLDEPGRARLRVVADACAAPKLRIALQLAASDAMPEALEEAFDAIEDGEARVRCAQSP